MFECYEFMKKSESHPRNPVFFDVGRKTAPKRMRLGSSQVLVIHISRGMCLMQFLSLVRGFLRCWLSENAFAIFTFWRV